MIYKFLVIYIGTRNRRGKRLTCPRPTLDRAAPLIPLEPRRIVSKREKRARPLGAAADASVDPPPSQSVTQLLQAWSRGDEASLERLLPVVYEELRRLARHHLRQQPSGHTLQVTALVHEAYLRLIDQQQIEWGSRAHFFGVAAKAMRSILIDHARRQRAAKRGAAARHSTLGANVESVASGSNVDLLALDEALIRLAQYDPRKSQVVELRYFGGLSLEEVAEVLGVSLATVKRDWTTARAWLKRELTDS